MPRRIGHNEFTFFRGKEPIGHVNGDALFAFCGQTINQQGKVDFLALGAHAFAVGLQLRQLIFENHFAVIEQAANQR